MKYKAKIYAQALASAILGKKAEEKKIINNFLKILEKNGDMKKTGDILLLSEKLLLKKTGNKKIVFETARKIESESFKKSLVKKGDVVEEKMNPALIAGIKIIINNEKQIDNSLLGKLNKII